MTHYIATPRRPFRWLRALFCPLLGHLWLVYRENRCRSCSYCRKTEVRGERETWSDQ